MEKENDTEIIDFLFDSIKKIFNKNKYIISILALPQNNKYTLLDIAAHFKQL